MFDCSRCVKNDVCMKKQQLRNFDINEIIQKNFIVDLKCVNYLPVAKILGGKNEQ